MEVKNELIEKLKKWVKETGIIDIDESDFNNPLGWENGFSFHDKKEEILRDGETKKEVYIVSFKSVDYVEKNENNEIISFLEGAMYFAYFDSETLNPLYIMGKTSYVEVDGSIIRL